MCECVCVCECVIRVNKLRHLLGTWLKCQSGSYLYAISQRPGTRGSVKCLATKILSIIIFTFSTANFTQRLSSSLSSAGCLQLAKQPDWPTGQLANCWPSGSQLQLLLVNRAVKPTTATNNNNTIRTTALANALAGWAKNVN